MTLPAQALTLLNAADEAKAVVDTTANTLGSSQEAVRNAQEQAKTDQDAFDAAVADRNQKVSAALDYLKKYFDGTLPQEGRPRPAATAQPTGRRTA